LPSKAGERKVFLEKYKNLDVTLIFYSAPHDIKKDLQSIYSVLGNRRAVTVKEITKIHEKAERFNLADGIQSEPKGEYVILVEGGKAENLNLKLSEKEHIDLYISRGLSKKEAIKKVAEDRGISKNDLYKFTLND
jgi:16S rRNA (cytidine1402-2'-O)-methyltransferase